jgi:hypothetical protein
MDDRHMMTPRKAGDDPNATGFSVMRIAMQGDDPAECASVVSAIIAVREDAWLTAERLRLESDPVQKSWVAKSAESRQLLEKSKTLRAELVAGLPAAGIDKTDISDASLTSLQLTGLLKQLQTEWARVREAWERASAELGFAQPLRPYAAVLQQPKAPVNPIGPQWAPYGWPWTLGGLAAGLIAGLVFRQLKAPREVSPPAPNLPPATAVEF